MCVDHTAVHLRGLEDKGVITKKFDKDLKGYAWSIPEPYISMPFRELIEKFPQLYKESLYICAIFEMDQNLGFDDIVSILYDLSEGRDTRPSVRAIKEKFVEKFLERYAKKE